MRIQFLDGNWALWRAWSTAGRTSAIPHKRIPLQILDWFCSYALTLQCQAGCLAFDGDKNFRYEVYKHYKSNRSGSGGQSDSVVDHGPLKGMTLSDAVYSMLEPTASLFRDSGIRVVQNPRYEADDVLCSGASKFGTIPNHVYLICRDKDMFQCVNENVTVMTPEMQGKPSVMYTPSSVPIFKHGLSPKQFLDYQILMGDGIDTIPAVPGMTSTRAVEMIKKYGSLSSFFKTKEGRSFYELRSTELHRNKNLVSLNKTMFPYNLEQISFKHLKDGQESRSLMQLKNLQSRSSLF